MPHTSSAEGKGPFEGAPSVLMVDDYPENLGALEVILEPLAVPLVKAPSGSEALKHLLGQDFAVILLDIRMPGMSGFETAELIWKRERSRNIPIIFLTAAETDQPEIIRAYGMGAVDFITKPFIPEVLRAKVSFFLELYRKNVEIRKNTARLERAIKDLEEFAYTVAHNLRAPLRAMAGFARILQDEYKGRPLNEEGGRFVQRIEEGSVRLDTLIRDLLSYIRLMHSHFSFGPVEVEPVITAALQELAVRVEETQAKVRVREPFPRVMAEPTLLGEIFGHLISNAMMYVKPGAAPEITVRAERRDGWVRLWVEDNGIGIPPQYHERVFGVFERLHASEQYPGTGIGLAIVRRAADRMGGKTGVESAEGQGSRFWVELKSTP